MCNGYITDVNRSVGATCNAVATATGIQVSSFQRRTQLLGPTRVPISVSQTFIEAFGTRENLVRWCMGTPR